MSKEARDILKELYDDLIDEKNDIIEEYDKKIKKIKEAWQKEEERILDKLKINDKDFVKLIEDFGFIMKYSYGVCDISGKSFISHQNFEMEHPKMWLFYQGYNRNGEYIVNNARISWPHHGEVFINPSDMTNEELIRKLNQLKNNAFKDKSGL